LASGSRPADRVAVRIEASVWAEEVERFAPRSPARVAAQRERKRLDQVGISPAVLLRCATAGADGTRLAGIVKTYLPIGDDPPSARPYGFVFAPGIDAEGRLHLELVAFGERHPRPGTRSVYERAHKRLHGRYPDQ
jgi:hypothetical protein